MFFLEFTRVIKFAWQSFFRNIWLSVVTVIIVTLSLFSISFLLMINILTQHVLDVVKDRTQVYIDLTSQATGEQAQALVAELQKLPAIKESQFITPEQTLENFKQRHQDDPVMAQSLNSLSVNPFTGSIMIKVNQIDDFPVILAELSKADYAPFLEIEDQEFVDSKLLIERISEYSRKVQNTLLAVCLLFSLISILVVFNTIQIGIYTHREEIGIMKLVGASNSFIRFPFLIEGFLYSLIGVILLTLLLYPFLILVQPYLDGFFMEYSINLITALNQNFFKVIGTELLIAFIITAGSSYLATRKYLKV